MKNKSRVLVTGGAGFIGTNLIIRLKENGHDIVSLDNYSTGLVGNHQDRVEYRQVDISNKLDLEKFDVVFHLAASARIQPSFKEPLNYFKSNALGTFNVIEYCAANSIPVIFAGSSSHHTGRLKNPYTFSKDISEDIIRLYQIHYGLQASICRFYNVYGPYQLKAGSYCTLIGKWEAAIENKKPIIVYGDGSKRRDFTHVHDIVDAIVRIPEKRAWGYEFELGRGMNYSVSEVASMFDYDTILYEPDKPGEADITLCDNSMAFEVLNWIPTKNLTDYIKDFKEKIKLID